MAGRPKIPTSEILSEEQANAAMLEMLTAQVELEKLQGAMDLARAAATTKFEKDLDARKSRLADLTEQLQTWYLAYAEVPENRKSITLAHGVIGDRISPPALKPLNRKWSWKAIGAVLQSKYGAKFFHAAETPKPDKDKIRAELDDEQLKVCGLKVEQDEEFYIELDRTTLGDTKA